MLVMIDRPMFKMGGGGYVTRHDRGFALEVWQTAIFVISWFGEIMLDI